MWGETYLGEHLLLSKLSDKFYRFGCSFLELDALESLVHVESVNLKLRQERRHVSDESITMANLYMESLYLSLDVKQCVKLCRDILRKSELTIQGVDYKCARVYLALGQGQAKIMRTGLQEIAQPMKYRNSPRPWISNI